MKEEMYVVVVNDDGVNRLCHDNANDTLVLTSKKEAEEWIDWFTNYSGYSKESYRVAKLTFLD